MNSSPLSKPITLYIDTDACPVKQEVFRVAERHALKGVALEVLVVSNSPITVPRDLFTVARGRTQNRGPLLLAARLLNGSWSPPAWMRGSSPRMMNDGASP